MSGAALLLVAVLALALLLDWRQTVTIARNPGRWRERNPACAWLMARAAAHGLRAELGVHVWFALAALFGAACVLLLGRSLWLYALFVPWLIAQLWCVLGNHRKGIQPARL